MTPEASRYWHPSAARSPWAPDESIAERLILHTENFGRTTWLGRPIRQNVLDLWVIQETIAELRPGLIIECGTNHGGSALFYANLLALLGSGHVVSVDLHPPRDLCHAGITLIEGDSVAPAAVRQVRSLVQQTPGPVLVILDSDHAAPHVARELEAYAPFVTTDGRLLVQDGVIDELPLFASGRPGPLRAVEHFLTIHPEFEVDDERCHRFPVTHHPRGWLRRLPDSFLAAAEQLQRAGLSRLAVYGTGAAARRFHEIADLRGLRVAAFLEREDFPAPASIDGVPVRPLSEAAALPLDAIVVTALRHSEEMVERVARLLAHGPGVRIVAPGRRCT